MNRIQGSKYIVKGTFDATSGKAIASHNILDDKGQRIIIPSGAVVTKAEYNVRTTFTDGASDTATIALTLQSAGDIKAAISIAAAGDVWDAGAHAGLPGNYALDGNALTAIAMAAAKAASYIVTTADRTLIATVATAALTAGVLDIYLEYYI